MHEFADRWKKTLNNNGKRLIKFCIDNSLIIDNSFYPHKQDHKITFLTIEREVNSIIDYLLYTKKLRKYFLDNTVICGAVIGSDDMLLIVVLGFYGSGSMILIADTRIFVERKIHSKAFEQVEVKQLNDPSIR